MITRADFPTSPLALRTANPDKQARIQAFADEQAAAANAARDRLAGLLGTAATHADRVAALRTVHAELVAWRYELATKAAGRLGQGIAYNAERFRTPITARNINFDRLGRVGRLRDGAQWDPATRTYTGGLTTPAYQAMLHYGQVAEDRFAAEDIGGDVLQNWVLLPDGQKARGNQILRGDAARAVAAELTARIAGRGIDPSTMETGGNPIYTATPDPQDSATLYAAALDLLADPNLSADTYRLGRYLLFQSPLVKKGSDAVNRTFIVTVGALVLGDEAPSLPADIDLRCYVLNQTAATR